MKLKLHFRIRKTLHYLVAGYLKWQGPKCTGGVARGQKAMVILTTTMLRRDPDAGVPNHHNVIQLLHPAKTVQLNGQTDGALSQ